MTEPVPPTTPTTPTTPQRREYKRERKQTAQILPPGITHNMMKKYVVYYREMTYLKDGKQQPREYFKVEAHPKLNKPWISSKSVKISLIEKLNDANQVVDDLDAVTAATTADISTITERWAKRLPKYATLRIVRDTPTATILSANYDRKDTLNGFRWTGSHTFSLPMGVMDDNAEAADADAVDAVDTVIGLEIQILREKLREKYGLDLWGV